MNFRGRKVEWITFSSIALILFAMPVIYILFGSPVLLDGYIQSWDDIPQSKGTFDRLPAQGVRMHVREGRHGDFYLLTGQCEEADLEEMARAEDFIFRREESNSRLDSTLTYIPFPVNEEVLVNLTKPGAIYIRGSRPGISFVIHYDPIIKTYLSYIYGSRDLEYSYEYVQWIIAKKAEWKRRK